MADDGKFFDLEIITPDRVFWTGKASMLEQMCIRDRIFTIYRLNRIEFSELRILTRDHCAFLMQ